MEVDDTNISLLKDMILDEGKLVTYLTLAKDLSIHINNSKLLMYSFIKYIREGNPKLDLNINFLISGVVKDNKVRMAVCSEDKLEEQKKMFKVVYFLHIYSISKGKAMENTAAVVNLTKYDDFNLCSGSIKRNVCMKRSVEEIGNLKNTSQKKMEDLQFKKAKQEDKPLKNVHEVGGKVFKSVIVPDMEIKKEIVSPKKDLKPHIHSRNQKGIAGFFNKQNGNGKMKENKIVIDSKPPVEKADLNPKTEKDIYVDKMDIDNEKETGDKEDAINEQNIMNDNKILNHIKKHSKVDKKRKRVLHVSDSDSEVENDPFVAEDEENKEVSPESDEEIPPTPATNNLKITTGIVNPRKKRKVVDKTYMSDDGYIITKREEVYESCSDSESMDNEVSVKKEIKEEKLVTSLKTKPNEIKNTPKKKKLSPPQKGKQATLMNFFSKK